MSKFLFPIKYSLLSRTVMVFLFLLLGTGLSSILLPSARAMMLANGEANGDEFLTPYPVSLPQDMVEPYIPFGSTFPQEPVVTDHSIKIDQKTINYTATAGFLPLTEETTGEELAMIFYISYELAGKATPSERPVTFVFNGGPGVASLFLHVGAFGPKTVPHTTDGTEIPRPPYSLTVNEHTLLEFTDLVFIDPVGTGFSRARSMEEAIYFWGVSEDVHATAEFIRLFLTRHERWLSPLFIAGESYGGLRAPALSVALQDLGIYPSGMVLLAPVLTYEAHDTLMSNPLAYSLFLPTMAATAWYHGKVDRDSYQDRDAFIEEVRHWSKTEYLLALNQGNALGAEQKHAIAATMSSYLGLSQEYIELNNLRIEVMAFASELLKEQSLSFSLYDSRLTSYGPYQYHNDPGFIIATGPFVAPFNDYLRSELGVIIDERYIELNPQTIALWNWLSGTLYGNIGYPQTLDSLETALQRTHFLQVFIGCGVYDLTTPYDHTAFMIQQLDLPADRLENIAFRLYEGGHMMYLNPAAHAQLAADLAAFYRQTLAE